MEQRQKDGKNRLLNFGNNNVNIFTSSRISKHFYKPHRTFIEFYSYRKTGFLFQENRLPGNLTAMQNIAIFMDKPDEGEIIALAAKVGLTAGDLNKYPTELSGGMAKRVAFFAPAAVRLRPCLAGRAVRRFGPRFARYFGRHAGGKNRAAGHGVYTGNARPLRSRTPEP